MADATVLEIPVPADAAARDALVARVRLLCGVSDPRLVPVVGADVRPDGVLEIRRGAGEAADLATVLAVRGAVGPAEAAGVLVVVAQGLAALHDAGLVHGPLSPDDVVLAADGSPRLRPRLEPAPPGGSPADDVHAAARLVEELVGAHDGEAATALRAVLAAALAPDPRVRPEAGTLAAWAHDAVEPEPVRLPEPAALAAASLAGLRPARRAAAGEPAARRRAFAGTTAGRAVPVPSRAGRGRGDGMRGSGARGGGVRRSGVRRSGRAGAGPARPVVRTAGVAAAVVAGVAVLATAGLVVRAPQHAPGGVAGADAVAVPVAASSSAPSSAPSPATSPSAGAASEPADPTRVLTDPAGAAAELTRRRVELLVTPGLEPDALLGVGAPGSPALAADQALAARLAAGPDARAGATAVVHDAEVVGRPATHRAEVTVTYTVEEGAGGAAESRTATLTLVWTPDGWRVEEVA
ncbi:hypothetical protein [Isoptericola variabilis]|uniref:hypothetical protein n=1 Tax=Isoptericola variabilis TaxID=139208 RepID=UPI000314DC09|nr:hypothetical protein [Isoptericola variabilis]